MLSQSLSLDEESSKYWPNCKPEYITEPMPNPKKSKITNLKLQTVSKVE